MIYDKAGNVQAVEYRVLDATGKVLDQGTASQKTIESAMKEKQGKETKSTISPETVQTVTESQKLSRDTYSSKDLEVLFKQ